ncbi:hypothetical protein [Methanimicrococcus hongohii]|nr:hypothetical protein [Methanimicrococcus sp. Hf6]
MFLVFIFIWEESAKSRLLAALGNLKLRFKSGSPLRAARNSNCGDGF